MAFFEEVFPDCISPNMTGGPRFRNRKATMEGGQRIVNQDDPYPLHDYILAVPIQGGSEFEQLRAFFYVVGGDRDGFRFKDWSDYIATQLNSNATPVAGVADTYQLNRRYVFGNRAFTRPIFKPVAGLQFFRTRSGITTNITGSSTISTTTGRVVVTGHASGDTYSWDGEFHVPVAFRDPAAVFNILGTPSMLTEWANIELEEFRV